MNKIMALYTNVREGQYGRTEISLLQGFPYSFCDPTGNGVSSLTSNVTIYRNI